MKHYKDIIVSPLNVDFSVVSVTDAPREFYANWFDLVVRTAQAIHPPFEAPAFPEIVEFKSDNYETNPITEVYYFIESKIFTVKGAGGYGIEFRSHEGFQQFDGNDCIEMEATGLPRDYPNWKSVSSTIRLKSAAPLASFHVEAEPEFLAAADKIFAELQGL